jgi:predicted outer membrane repeat protein
MTAEKYRPAPSVWFATAMLLLVPGAASAATWFVNASAAGANTGASWADAYTSLQSALASAASGDEIWIAGGVYKPSVAVDVDGNGSTEPREVTFHLPSGVKLYGGFAGGEASIDDRDWNANPTILSGDIDNNDQNGDGNHIAETTADLVGNNAFHVIFTQSVTSETWLDGFIVTAGKAATGVPPSFSPNRHGGGWYNKEGPAPDTSSPTIQNTRFSGNYAETSGGALYIGSFTKGTYNPTLSDCEFSGNEARSSGGAVYLLGDAAVIDRCSFKNNSVTITSMGGETSPGSGGAVFMHASNATFDRCMFIGNSATGNPTGPFEGGGGGAVYVNNSQPGTDTIGASHPKFFNCGFYGNSAGGNGGGWGGAALQKSDGGNVKVSYVGCVFSGNTATNQGGATASFARTITPPAVLPPILEPEFTNCTFFGNSAGQSGGAAYFDGFVFDGAEMLHSRIENSILYGDSAVSSGSEVSNSGVNLVAYSLIQGSGGSGGGWDASIGTDGGNNTDANPQFTNSADPDGADNVPGNSDDGLFPTSTSPVVDTGNSAAAGLAGVTSDFANNARVQGPVVDRGAYEQASTGSPCGALPAGLTNTDIGNTGGYAGSVCYDSGEYTVDASGSNIWGKKDGFHYVYKKMNGNGEIIARIDNVGNDHFWDLAGVMMRARLTDNSEHVLVAANSHNLSFMRARKNAGGPTHMMMGGLHRHRVWVRLVRVGNLFAGFKSLDGVKWKAMGIAHIPMPHTIFVGVATSTPKAGTAHTYVVSHVSF